MLKPLSKTLSNGIGRKALIAVIIIVAGGVAVGFFTNSRPASVDQTNGVSTGTASFGASLGIVSSSNSNQYDYSQGVGQAVSATTVVPGVTTVVTTEAVPATSVSGGTTIKPNATPQQGASTLAVNTSASSGFIEFFSNVTVQVSSPQASLSKAMAIAYTYGGYVAFSSFNNYSSVAVLRVPASNYQSALAQVEGLGNLTGFQTNSNDFSVQYTDLNATLQSLLSEQASLLNLENKSTSLNSTLIIENELQGVNAQINEIQSQILQTRTLIDYSTITVTLNRGITITVTPLSLRLIATPQSGMAPLAVTFNSLVTGGSAPYIVNYNFGDGTSYQGETLIHTFNQKGTFNVTVTATDSNGTVKEAWTLIHVSAAPSNSFRNFSNYVSGLLIAVVEGIVEVAVVTLPIALVVGLVILPFRNRLRTNKGPNQ